MRGLSNMGDNCPTGTLTVRTATTFTGRLQEEKQNLEKRLADVNMVLKSLEEAPEVAKVLEALNKLGF